MAPWEELGYFELPKFTYITFTSGARQKLVGFNNRRTALRISAGNGTIWISPDNQLTPDPTSTVFPGCIVQSTTLPFVVYQKDDPVQCCCEWFGVQHGAFVAPGPTITILESLLIRWPEELLNEEQQSYIRSLTG